MFSRLSHYNEMHLLTVLGLFTDGLERFRYPSTSKIPTLSYFMPEKGTPLGRSLPV